MGRSPFPRYFPRYPLCQEMTFYPAKYTEFQLNNHEPRHLFLIHVSPLNPGLALLHEGSVNTTQRIREGQERRGAGGVTYKQTEASLLC